MTWCRWRFLLLGFLCLADASPALAQRELHWDRLEVTAHLDAEGQLHVTETQDMVFTGAWNGGERQFDVRPRQRFVLRGVTRIDGARRIELRPDGSIDDIDEYNRPEPNILRWRSRLPSDPPFAGRVLRYEFRYELTNVLQADGDAYRLRHDFAFPDREGAIRRFAVRLTFDPAWAPPSDFPAEHRATALAPGSGYVLNVPLRYTGVTPPRVEPLRSSVLVNGVFALLGLTGLAVVWFFVREERLGRFAPPEPHVDEAWLREHVLRHPAEVVGAAWDGAIGKPEVVALIARLVADGKLTSGYSESVFGEGSTTLRLNVDRSSLSGYERTLVERLFVGGRAETSPSLVKSHYSDVGFDPVSEIRDELQASVDEVLPPGDPPRSYGVVTFLLFLAGVALFVYALMAGAIPLGRPLWWGALGLLLFIAGVVTGAGFNMDMGLGRRAAFFCLLPALALSGGVAAWLWVYGDSGVTTMRPLGVIAIVTLGFALVHIAINILKSGQHRHAIAFRKRLSAAKAFFASELEKDQPALRDEWIPWLLALELGKHVDDWSAQQRHAPVRSTRRRRDEDDTTWAHRPSGSSSETATAESWGGFGGGRSGGAGGGASWTGAGGGASWAAAMGGFTAGVPAPSASSSDGSSSSDSGSSYSSSDSSSSSSGGGGGGGW